MVLYSALKLLHQGIVNKNEKYMDMLAQNIYYIVPIINKDGVALIEKEFPKKGDIMKKRKNMNPNATKSKKGYTCAIEDSGVDLNRNYPIDFGVGVRT